MNLAIDLFLDYRLDRPQPVLLAVEAADAQGQSVTRATLTVEGAALRRFAGEAGVGTRLWAHGPDERMRLRYRAGVTVARATEALEGMEAAPMDTLPPEVLSFLRPSRLCPSDTGAVAELVAARFSTGDGGARLAAIRDWVGAEIAYRPAASHAATTACDTIAAGAGVCRDFAHVVCTLARAAGVPARYASVYAPGVTPPDFHAVAEVWLDGAWRLVDATGMSAPGDTVLIGVGRDACDVPFMETEFDAAPVSQVVSVQAAGPSGAE